MSTPNRFTQIMSTKTDSELIRIVTVDRGNYETLAIEAADIEIQSRNIDPNQQISIEQDLSHKKQIQNFVDENRAGSFARFIHLIIDRVACWVLALILIVPVELLIPNQMEYLKSVMTVTFLCASFFIYFIGMEYFFQKTLGKFITGTKVVKGNGEKPELKHILARTFFRLIPLDALSFLAFKNGFHDNLSKTYVIKDRKKLEQAI